MEDKNHEEKIEQNKAPKIIKHFNGQSAPCAKYFKTRKSVNWNIRKFEEINKENYDNFMKKKSKDDNDKVVKFSAEKVLGGNSEDENDNEFIAIEVIEGDGKIQKLYQSDKRRRASEQFIEKREKIRRDEYTKAKEFYKSHQNED